MMLATHERNIGDDLRRFAAGRLFGTVLADPAWRFINRTGKVAPEHRRLARYETLSLDAICALPVASVMADNAHLYQWVPNALMPDGVRVMEAWGFKYKTYRAYAQRLFVQRGWLAPVHAKSKIVALCEPRRDCSSYRCSAENVGLTTGAK